MFRCVLGIVLVACGSGYDPPSASPEEADEAMVSTFEQMADLAGQKPTCERWADENKRRFGASRLTVMTERIRTFDDARRQAFQAKFGERIRKANELVEPIARRCVDELRGR